MPRRIYTYPDALGLGSLNMLTTVGAFVLGIGVLISIVNLFVSIRSGKIAGKNPWNADTLEWGTDSPPAPYGTVHIPTVVSRNPLWDDHDEEDDPKGSRVLDRGRQTPSTTWLDAEPFAIAQMPTETIAPLVLAIALGVFFCAMVFELLWLALAGLIATFATCCYWLWPRHRREEQAA
jgi:hypothetical protein